MVHRHRIASVGLADRDSRFGLEAESIRDDTCREDLLLTVEIATSSGTWTSRAVSVLSPGIESVASAASAAARGVSGGSTIDYATTGEGAALAFSFRLVPERDCVVVTVVVDSGLTSDEPTPSGEGPGTVLLRVLPHEVDAFAEALEELATREPGHVLWAG